MNIKPLLSSAACDECWSAYPDVHSDKCSRSTLPICTVCGGRYSIDTGTGRCDLTDAAHQTPLSEAA